MTLLLHSLSISKETCPAISEFCGAPTDEEGTCFYKCTLCRLLIQGEGWVYSHFKLQIKDFRMHSGLYQVGAIRILISFLKDLFYFI